MRKLILILLLLPSMLIANEPSVAYSACKDICSVRTRCTVNELRSWSARLYTTCFNSCLQKPQESITCFKFYQNSCGRLDSCLQGVEYSNYRRNGFK